MQDRDDGAGRVRARRRRGIVAVAMLLAAVGAGSWWAADRHAASERAAAATTRTAIIADIAAQSEIRTKDIAFYTARAAGDPEGAWDRAQLAELYLQRARETSDYQDYLSAERLAREALALRTEHNEQGFVMLAASLMAQHRFVEARDAASQLVHLHPEIESYQALLGETCLEIGDYAGARAAFTTIDVHRRSDLGVAPRIARWAEVLGDTAQARVLLRGARALATGDAEIPREQRAWFHLRVGDLELRQGRIDRAEREFRDGLTVLPGDHRLLAAMARIASARHAWREAIDYGDSAVAVTLDPATLGIVADAYSALGDTAKAAEYVRTMEVAVGQQPGAYHRAWSLFLLDHGRQGPQVLAAAERELTTRRDIYGYDVLAWALYKQGRPVDARRAMAAALAQGTQDAMLFYHAGLIERAAGNAAGARNFLQRALAVSPVFDAAGPAVARAVLDTLAHAPTQTVAVTR